MTRTKCADAAWDMDVLADGAIVLKASYQLDWVYLTVSKGAKVTRRRYRHGQKIEVQA